MLGGGGYHTIPYQAIKKKKNGRLPSMAPSSRRATLMADALIWQSSPGMARTFHKPPPPRRPHHRHHPHPWQFSL